MSLVACNPTAVDNSSRPVTNAGNVWIDPVTGFHYMYVKFDDGVGNVAAEEGGIVHWKVQPGLVFPQNSNIGSTANAAVATVTSDVSDSLSAGGYAAAGVLLGSVTDGNFTWILKKGVFLCKVAALTAVGDAMVGGATDLTFDRVAAGTAPAARVYGRALEAIGGTESGKAFCQVDFGA